MMHVYNYINPVDKLVHIFMAAYPQGLYEQAIRESMHEYGKRITRNAVRRFSKRCMKYYI